MIFLDYVILSHPVQPQYNNFCFFKLIKYHLD